MVFTMHRIRDWSGVDIPIEDHKEGDTLVKDVKYENLAVDFSDAI